MNIDKTRDLLHDQIMNPSKYRLALKVPSKKFKGIGNSQ